ncbi:MAG: hypothetical protein IPJ65_34595 [Archangiaceae bacterium]|nr:hypothetical protein [Archangiaceae bacterium]
MVEVTAVATAATGGVELIEPLDLSGRRLGLTLTATKKPEEPHDGSPLPV